MPVYRNDLMCGATSLSYDFDLRAGALHLAEGNTCDMTGCTGLFLAIDPDVQWIETFSGKKPDTAYRRLPDGNWEAMPSKSLGPLDAP